MTCPHIKGIWYWNIINEFTPTDRSMQARICLKSWDLDILVSSTNFLKSSIGWHQQPPTEKVLKFSMIFHDSTNSSVVIFQALEPLQPQWPLPPQKPPWPQWPLKPHFINIYCSWWLDTPWEGTKWPIMISTLSIGGCWGQPILLFWKLVNVTKISKL